VECFMDLNDAAAVTGIATIMVTGPGNPRTFTGRAIPPEFWVCTALSGLCISSLV